MVDFQKIREEQWPALKDMTFLDAACVSLTPQNAVNAMVEFTKYTANNEEFTSTAHHLAMDARRHKAYEEAAKLLNADMNEIALVESTTYGLNIAAQTMKLNPGDTVLTTSLEFLQVAMPWCMMRSTHGINVKAVKGRNGRFELSDFVECMDNSVKMIVMSSVEWCNGWRMNLKEIGDYCKAHNIYLVIDAVHEMGVMKIDTKQIYVSLMVAGGHKWMNSPFGTGVMYVNKDLIPKLTPPTWGYLNTVAPEGGWGAYFGDPKSKSINDWQFPADSARKFEVGGTCNYLGAIALGESLGLVNEIGIENIEARVLELRDYLYEELPKIGAHLTTQPDKDHRSGLVVFRFYNDPAEEHKLVEFLHQHKVYCACRFTDGIGGVRIACQYYVTKADLDRLMEVLKEAAKIKAPDFKA